MLKIPTSAFTELRYDNVAVTKKINVKVDMRTGLKYILDQYLI